MVGGGGDVGSLLCPPPLLLVSFILFSLSSLSASYRRVISLDKICFSKIMTTYICGAESAIFEFVPDLAFDELASLTLHRLYAPRIIFDINLKNKF